MCESLIRENIQRILKRLSIEREELLTLDMQYEVGVGIHKNIKKIELVQSVLEGILEGKNFSLNFNNDENTLALPGILQIQQREYAEQLGEEPGIAY